jgi:hypothetical protein
MVKMITKQISFQTKDGKQVSFVKQVRAPPKTSAQLKARLKKVPMALRVQANKKWQLAHPKAGVKDSKARKHSKITGRIYRQKL